MDTVAGTGRSVQLPLGWRQKLLGPAHDRLERPGTGELSRLQQLVCPHRCHRRRVLGMKPDVVLRARPKLPFRDVRIGHERNQSPRAIRPVTWMTRSVANSARILHPVGSSPSAPHSFMRRR